MTNDYYIAFAHSLANFIFPICTSKQLLFIQPCVHAIFDETVIQRTDSITVCVSVTEKDF